MSRSTKSFFSSDNLIKNLPNALTITNMLLGLTVISLVIAYHSREIIKVGCLLIILGAIIDGVDGKLARYLNATSDFGKELDSFADFVTFGVAPVSLLWQLDMFGGNFVSFLLLAVYPLAGAFRLARYNIGDYRDYFLGLPITCAGILMALFILVMEMFTKGPNVQILSGLTAVILLVLSLLMVSSIKVPRLNFGHVASPNSPFGIRIK